MDDVLRRMLTLLDATPDERAFEALLAPYRLGPLLHDGQMALVYETAAPRSFVIKSPSAEEGELTLASNAFPNRLEALQYEASVLGTARDSSVPNVVKLIDDRTSHDVPFLVLERLGRSAADELDDNEGRPRSRRMRNNSAGHFDRARRAPCIGGGVA